MQSKTSKPEILPEIHVIFNRHVLNMSGYIDQSARSI